MVSCKILIAVLVFVLFSGQPVFSNPLQPVWTRSYILYHQPHAVWLVRQDGVYFDTDYLKRALLAAEEQGRAPEIAIYALPDLQNGSYAQQIGEAGYWQANLKAARLMKAFYRRTGISPVVYLEPDSIGHALDAHAQSRLGKQALESRLALLHSMVRLYSDAGARVYLDATHSDWYGVSDEKIGTMATALQRTGISEAAGFFTNVSNRQKISPVNGQGELPYIKKLIAALGGRDPDVVVDTSRNGWQYLSPRTYRLSVDGNIVDNETAAGRVVGHWRNSSRGVMLQPFIGRPRLLSDLSGSDGYSYDESAATLYAPLWLDPVGDVHPGPKPTDNTGTPPIDKFRYIKPPDECDGSLACPAGFSKSLANNMIDRRNVLATAPDGEILAAVKDLWRNVSETITALGGRIALAEN